MIQTIKCPICRKAIAWQGNSYRPFCSARCRTTDLGTWAADSYRIPGEKADTEEQSKDDEAS